VRASFSAKLMGIFGAAALALTAMVTTSSLFTERVSRHLSAIEQRYLPRMELGHRLEDQFDGIRRSFQDAVAAQDRDALASTRALKDAFLLELAHARDVIDPATAVQLRAAFEDYYASAHDVSSRLVADDAGEALVDAVAAMQAKLARTGDLLRKATVVEERELAAAFQEAARAQETAGQVRLLVSVVCSALVLLLTLWMIRSVLRSLAEVSSGFERFGKGDFAEPISVHTHDELGQLAERANLMASSLDELGKERDRSDWLKAGQAGLMHELRGELEPAEVATRAIGFLARYLDAPVAAFYTADRGVMRLLGHYASSEIPAEGEPHPCFRMGEGLVGQAALRDEITVLGDPPPGYLRVRSGLGESAPRAIVILPLTHAGTVSGVLEFALLEPWSASDSELLLSLRETLAIAIEVARARAALREALAETQRQARSLVAQEEELRAANEELESQQHELREANEELTHQAEELATRQTDLEQSNSELAVARQRIEQKADELTMVSAYKSQFLANMSHELRTPLNSMLLLSDLLASNDSGNLTDKQVEFCQTIHGAGRDLLALINQVLDLAKIESGKQEARIEPVALRELVVHAQRMFTPQARDKGLELAVELASGAPETIATDRQRIEQILNNLLGNAIKFTERGSVQLRIGPPDAGTHLTRNDLRVERTLALVVRDTGIGIAPEHLEKVFAPFEQVEGTSSRRFGGTGLGLTISRELATMLGGELQVQSQPGRGSTFTCFLPFEGPAAARPGDGRVSAGDRSPPIHVGDGHDHDADSPDILVIEDDPVFAGSVEAIVRDQGLRCAVAGDAATGLRLARERRPRGIILDVKLPDTDGFKVMESLRAEPSTASIPVHFVSAVDAGERGLALGAVGYLTKPVTRRDLTQVVESLAPKVADRTCRVLIVEDDAAVAESLAQRLSSEDFAVRRAPSASQALDLLGRERFHCMVLDLSLPDMDGLEFLESLQGKRDAETPPVVVYTGRALSKAETQRLEAYTEAIVLKEGPGEGRLLDEVRLFARRLKRGLPASRKAMAPRMHVNVRLHGIKVLLADDDMRTVYALSALLRAKGAEVMVADTGVAALDMLANHPDVSIVLMDIMMPEMDGYEAMRRIRRDARFAGLPIVALTAKAMRGDREKCIEAGASDYLSKPIDPDALVRILHSRLSESAVHGA
jgi:signal transduction histidine kinase/DNA-binding response OmpR family regulator